MDYIKEKSNPNPNQFSLFSFHTIPSASIDDRPIFSTSPTPSSSYRLTVHSSSPSSLPKPHHLLRSLLHLRQIQLQWTILMEMQTAMIVN
ncbi:hypothetical protein QVD17_30973 [Tagetes erecta]|uniref:Uncharacterized protein n=1 Tax=Tagetes erecta TaxID=13708 RepID=A0AAD8NGJ7_TARER|nr:hypothetical protein QVD17_30973 [Tagetes erecta]